MATDEFTFEFIHPTDIIWIKTTNSTYRFSVLDPETRMGMLSGGPLGQTPVKACFLCSVGVMEKYTGQDSTRLKVGSRAMFLYRSDGGERHIVTSVIKNIARTR